MSVHHMREQFHIILIFLLLFFISKHCQDPAGSEFFFTKPTLYSEKTIFQQILTLLVDWLNFWKFANDFLEDVFHLFRNGLNWLFFKLRLRYEIINVKVCV